MIAEMQYPKAERDITLMAEKFLLIFMALVGGFFVFLLIVAFARWLNDFDEELRYLNGEINRTDGAEQRYWKCRKKHLLLSVIPFIRYRGDI